MAAFDWNGDGKNDIIDDLIEFQICKDAMNKDKNKSIESSSNYYKKPASGTSFGKGFLVFIVCSVIACFNEIIAAIIFLAYLFFSSVL